MEVYVLMENRAVKSELMFKGKVFDVYRDDIALPNGKTAPREYVLRGHAAAVIAEDENGKIFFVRQYRHAARDLCLEIPAGMLEPGEDPAVAAARELEEEIGYKSLEPLKFLVRITPSVGICTEQISIYIAGKLEKTQQHLDEDEFVEIEKYTLEEAIKLVYEGKIYDSKTVAAVFMYKAYLEDKK